MGSSVSLHSRHPEQRGTAKHTSVGADEQTPVSLLELQVDTAQNSLRGTFKGVSQVLAVDCQELWVVGSGLGYHFYVVVE
jgi:hypothetical protein